MSGNLGSYIYNTVTNRNSGKAVETPGLRVCEFPVWEIAVHLAVACDVYDGLFVLFFFPRGVLDEILNLIESVSDGFPSYFFTRNCGIFRRVRRHF